MLSKCSGSVGQNTSTSVFEIQNTKYFEILSRKYKIQILWKFIKKYKIQILVFVCKRKHKIQNTNTNYRVRQKLTPYRNCDIMTTVKYFCTIFICLIEEVFSHGTTKFYCKIFKTSKVMSFFYRKYQNFKLTKLEKVMIDF